MKTAIYFLLIILSLKVFAVEIEVPHGVFTFQKQLNSLLTKKTELIDTRSVAGAERKQKLINQGWECFAQTSVLFKCSIASRVEAAPKDIFDKVSNQFKDYSVLFSDFSSASLNSHGDMYDDYVVSQQVSIGAANVQSYILMKFSNGPYKLKLRLTPESEPIYFNMVDASTISFVLIEKVLDQNVSTTYFIEVLLQK